ncbi:MAG: four helix bundle protein [Patescibacteria group bacterium]|nr:four helix bundle protein [Patescibacteria group bacterium]
MATINSFENLDVYKKAGEFKKDIYKLVKNFPLEEKFNLYSQMSRAATSITNNIAEGFGRQVSFSRKYSILQAIKRLY